MKSGSSLRRILGGVVGVVGFSVLMAAREGFTSPYARALVAGLAALVGGCALLYVQRTGTRAPPAS